VTEDNSREVIHEEIVASVAESQSRIESAAVKLQPLNFSHGLDSIGKMWIVRLISTNMVAFLVVNQLISQFLCWRRWSDIVASKPGKRLLNL
jgi:hypothetical protein